MAALLELIGSAGVLIPPIAFLDWWAFCQAQKIYAEWHAFNDVDGYDPDPPQKEPVLKIPDECGDFCLLFD